MLYRPFQPEDFNSLYAIEELCFQPPFRFGRVYMRQILSRSRAAAWIAEENQQMAGFAIVEWTRESTQIVAYIQTVEVAPAHRQRGIANQLLSRIELSATTAGSTVLWLHVHEQNAAAIRLYESRDYLPQGREENYYAPGLSALIYAKPLPSPPLVPAPPKDK